MALSTPSWFCKEAQKVGFSLHWSKPPNENHLRCLCQTGCLFCGQLPSGWLGTWVWVRERAGKADSTQREEFPKFSTLKAKSFIYILESFGFFIFYISGSFGFFFCIRVWLVSKNFQSVCGTWIACSWKQMKSFPLGIM